MLQKGPHSPRTGRGIPGCRAGTPGSPLPLVEYPPAGAGAAPWRKEMQYSPAAASSSCGGRGLPPTPPARQSPAQKSRRRLLGDGRPPRTLHNAGTWQRAPGARVGWSRSTAAQGSRKSTQGVSSPCTWDPQACAALTPSPPSSPEPGVRSPNPASRPEAGSKPGWDGDQLLFLIRD